MPRDRRQTSSQAPQLVRPLPPEAEGVEEFVVDALHDLADGSYPPPQALGPAPLAAVAFRRMDDARPVAFQPAPMVFFALKALVGYIWSPGRRSHARGSRGFGRCRTAKKVSAACWSVAEAPQKPKPVMMPVGSVATSKRKPSYHPRLLDHPMSARPASHPSPRRLASRTGIAELSRAW